MIVMSLLVLQSNEFSNNRLDNSVPHNREKFYKFPKNILWCLIFVFLVFCFACFCGGGGSRTALPLLFAVGWVMKPDIRTCLSS